MVGLLLSFRLFLFLCFFSIIFIVVFLLNYSYCCVSSQLYLLLCFFSIILIIVLSGFCLALCHLAGEEGDSNFAAFLSFILIVVFLLNYSYCCVSSQLFLLLCLVGSV